MSGAVCPGKAENMTKAEEKESKQTFLADMLARLIPAYDDAGHTLGYAPPDVENDFQENDYRENIFLPAILNSNEMKWLTEAANGKF
jgi:hypothetical protein